MTSNKSQAIQYGILPRDARVPADVNFLLSISPIEHTFRAFSGGLARIQEIRSAHISSLIKSALQAA
jgi:hypothetical protein